MTIGGVFIIVIELLILPPFIGMLIPGERKISFRTLLMGYLIEWSMFYPISVVLILNGAKLSLLCQINTYMVGIASVVGAAMYAVKKIKKPVIKDIRTEGKKRFSKMEMAYLAIFVLIFLFQIYKTIFYAYADGDDAYYIAIAQNAVSDNTMYLHEPYTGTKIGLENINYRYALAPFPMWIAYLARTSGISVAIVSHVFLPFALISLTYIIYGEISKRLFAKSREKQFIFMDLISLLIMFSNVSTSTAETFLLTRARQGKEALANIVFPFLFLVLMEIHYEVQSKCNKISNEKIILVCVTSLCASLMSVFGSVLFTISLFAFGCILLLEKKKLRLLSDVVLMAVPGMISALIYIVLG